ncbi:MAG: DegT/DnrJ/EryC1/StrS family aminotransferase [Candidatus Bathyarchaeota archaeon]|nr:MAG: DegT/DnrJ/EryC1/StrS family aminotransferase [Candidatus Bathyarchaeota archaeon]
MISINKPLLDEREVEAVARVLRSGRLTSRTESGSMVAQFETAFAEFVRTKHAFAVNNGTAALYLSLLASKVGPGSEVVLPSFTFVSTAEAVVLADATPVFVDIDPETYNTDPEEVEKAVTGKTRAIIPVDLYGLPVEMKTFNEVAEKHGLIIIEDAAQAHGAQYAGKPAGSFADLACWSFYASKNLTTGEGGMITTNSDEFAEKLPSMRSHGENEEYISSMVGGNFRMPEMEAAIGSVQLQKLPAFLERRQRNAERLAAKLQKVKDLKLPIVPEGYIHSWYLFTVRLKDSTEKKRDEIVEELRKLGIGATVYYRVPIHMMPFYRKYCITHLPNTEKAATQVFSLPIHPAVTAKQIDFIADSLQNLLQ